MADPLEAACSLVGRFQYHFGRVEQKIDQAVIKLLDLDDKAGPIVTGSVDFAKKVNFVRTSAFEQARNDNDKQFADDTCDEVFKIKLHRVIEWVDFSPIFESPAAFVVVAVDMWATRLRVHHVHSGASRMDMI